MPSDQDIRDQQEQLQLQRTNLRNALRQATLQGGEAYALPAVQHSIAEARARIASIKVVLRGWDVDVEDLPNDMPPSDDLPPIVRRSGGDGGKVDQRRGVFANGGTFHAPVIGYQENNGVAAPDPMPAQPPAAKHQADVLLITVTEEETEAVFDALQDQTGREPEPHYQGDKTYYDLGLLGGARVWLVRSEMGAVTPGGAFSTVYTAIPAMRPAAILMVGIAFGVDPAGQQIGDVLVARQLQSYEPQRVGTVDGVLRLIPRGDRVTASMRALDRCRDAARTWKTARVKFGLVLSGDKLLDHQPAVAALLAQEPEAVGGEMEGAGLYVAATQHRIDWLLIKAICDWADGNKAQDKAARQALAAQNAARFAVHLVAKGGFAPQVWKG